MGGTCGSCKFYNRAILMFLVVLQSCIHLSSLISHLSSPTAFVYWRISGRVLGWSSIRHPFPAPRVPLAVVHKLFGGPIDCPVYSARTAALLKGRRTRSIALPCGFCGQLSAYLEKVVIGMIDGNLRDDDGVEFSRRSELA